MGIKGDDIVMYLSEVGDPYPKLIGCDRNLSLTLNNDFYKVSDLTPDFFYLIPTFGTWTIESETLYITGTDTLNGSEQIMTWAIDKTELIFSIDILDTNYSGRCYIATAQITANYNTVCTVAITFNGSGPLNISDTVDVYPLVYSFEYS